MKKLLFSLLLIVSFANSGNAQTKPAAAKAKVEKAAPAKAADTKMKADGTPDMRYNANKKKAAPAGPLKKDGTADMRFKKNKKA